MKRTKENCGVTLVALVVTIVVLLILAGITINIMLGDNNIFSKAKKAKEEMDIAKIREKIETIRIDWWAEKKQDSKISINEFWDKLVNEKVIESKDVIEGPEKQENDNVYLIKTLEGYIVEIIEKADGNIIIGKINEIIEEQEEISISARLGYVTEGLILHYDAIENTKEGHSNSTETWYDLTENGNDGILNGCVWQDSCLQLNGSGDGIQVQDKLKDLFKSSNTIEMTVMFNENSNRDILIGNYSASNNIDYEKYYSNASRIWFANGGIDHSSTSNVIAINKCQNLSYVMNKSNNTIEVFNNVNKIDSIKNSIIGSYNYDWTNVWIGRDSRTGSTCLKGKIASVRVYNRNLSESEIEQNYQVDEERFTIINEADISDYVANGLILHYDGIENTSSGHNSSTKTWYDLSGHGNNGDLYGCTWGSSYLELNGSSDGIQIQNKLKDLFKSSNTIEMTVMFNENSNRDILIGNYSASNNIDYEKYSSNGSRIWFANGGIDHRSTSDVLTTNNYQNLSYVMNKSNNTIEVFKDASKIDSIQSSIIGSYNYDWTNVWIGRDSRTGSTCLKGRIASVRVYNRNLSESEINQNYQIDKKRLKIP